MKKYSVVQREVRDVEGQELRTTVLFPAGEEGKNSDKSEKGYSIIQIALGLSMLIIGMNHLPPSPAPDSFDPAVSEETAGPVPKESDPCPNGAAYFLFVAGIVILVTNLISIVTKISQHVVAYDGKVTCGEKCGLGLLGCASFVLGIVDTVMLFW